MQHPICIFSGTAQTFNLHNMLRFPSPEPDQLPRWAASVLYTTPPHTQLTSLFVVSVGQ